MLATMKAKIQWVRQNPKAAALKALPIVVPVLVFLFLFVAVSPTFAQDVTLDIDTDEMKNGLFNGANIIIAALGTVMFLLAGFKLGGILIRGIVDAIGTIRF